MRTLITLCLALMLLVPMLVVADADAEPEEEDLEAAVAEILERPLDEDEAYGETQHCISRPQLRSIDVLDERRIAFRLRDGSIWLNQLRSVCPGLHARQAIVLEATHGTSFRICRMDQFFGTERTALTMSPMHRTPPCMLGSFERISDEQLALLKEALAEGPPRRTQRR